MDLQKSFFRLMLGYSCLPLLDLFLQKTSASFLSKSELQELSEVFVCFDFSSGTRVGGFVDQTMKTPLVEQQRRAKHVET